MIQYEMSVEDFWYAMADWPALMEEAFAAFHANQLKQYAINVTFPADGFYQDENTSTTLLSPSYYRKYSFHHIRDFARAVHGVGRRLVVHMCGHVNNLLPNFPDTGMDGIDCLTPPPVGDTPFVNAFRLMPSGFFCTGRFGSSLWFHKTRAEIMKNLVACLPHHVYGDHAFVLAVTGDGIADIPLDNVRLLRDCINEHETKA